MIELLVVISIIGIISSFAVVQLNSSRQKARDAMRKSDSAQLRTALMLYYDNNLEYPACGTYVESGDYGTTADCYNNTLLNALTGGSRPLLAEMPTDPLNQTNSEAVDSIQIYKYASDGEAFAITYNLEEGGAQIVRGW